jgi:hypothetical protein
MKKCTTICTLIFVNMIWLIPLKAQYYVSASKGTYTELDNPTVIAAGPTFTTNYKVNIAGGVKVFNKFYGLDYASTQGEETNIFPTPALLITEQNSNNTNAEFSVFGNCGATGIDATSSVSYQLTGDNKTGMVKFQWKNIGLKNSGSSTDFINVQLWLNRADNSFTIVMGPGKVTGTTAFGTHGGVAIGVDQYDAGFNQILARGYIQGDPAAPTMFTKAGSTSVSPPVLTAIPVSGTTYLFKFNPHTSAINPIITEDQDIQIYPNPANRRFTVNCFINAPGTVKITLSDIMGNQVILSDNKVNTVGNFEKIICTDDLKPGIYYCSVSAEGILRTGKLVVYH